MTPDQLKSRLMNAFPSAARIDVIDQTGSQDHYEVRIVSEVFDGLNRIQRKQKVMAVVSDELTTGEIHAFSIFTETPDQFSAERTNRN